MSSAYGDVIFSESVEAVLIRELFKFRTRLSILVNDNRFKFPFICLYFVFIIIRNTDVTEC